MLNATVVAFSLEHLPHACPGPYTEILKGGSTIPPPSPLSGQYAIGYIKTLGGVTLNASCVVIMPTDLVTYILSELEISGHQIPPLQYNKV